MATTKKQNRLSPPDKERLGKIDAELVEILVEKDNLDTEKKKLTKREKQLFKERKGILGEEIQEEDEEDDDKGE